MSQRTVRTLVILLLVVSVRQIPSAASLPPSWSSADVGSVGAAGIASGVEGTLTVSGAGSDVWGTADAFRFAYLRLVGDGSVVAQVKALDAVNAWTKGGVMMRESLAPNSRHAFMLVSPGKGLAFQRRLSTGGESAHTAGGNGTAPVWLKLTRAGSTFSAYRSANGTDWTLVGSDTIAMDAAIYAGVAVSSHVSGVLATGTFSGVQVTPTWSTSDIGAVGAVGSFSVSGGGGRIAGAGADVWGTADAFRYAYVPMTGDGAIVAQVSSEEPVNAWTKAGVMMRESLASNARHAFMLVSPGKGLAFQRRLVTGGDSSSTSGGAGTAPMWVKLTREGGLFSAFRSTDGATWSLVGSDSIAMGSTIYVGVAVSSHVAGTLAAAAFSSVSLAPNTFTTDAPPPPPPPPPLSSTTFRLLHWNTHHGGIGTDGVYDPARLARWIAQLSPDVASLNEVDDTSQMNQIVSRLNAITGQTWYTMFGGAGNLLISRLPVDAATNCTYNPSYPRVAPHLTITLNGRPLNLFSTHLAVDSATTRLAEVKAMQACASAWPEAHVIAGDYNTSEGTTEYNQAVVGYADAWKVAKALGTAVNFAGNCDGCTRNGRIDYVFTSTAATFLQLKSAEVVDTRDASGVTPSDHKPLVVVYQVN